MAEDMVDCVSGSPTFMAELKIPVPWGHIAAKASGNPGSFPILAIHGWHDNAATFDCLIPLLPCSQFYIVSIDLPGHGFSSHLHPGVPYRFTDYLTTLKRIVDHFGWRKLHLLCHSLGGMLGYYFSSSYPDLIDKFIVIDIVSGLKFPKHYHPELLRHSSEQLVLMEQRLKGKLIPQYSYEEAVRRLISGRATELTRKAAETLLSRNLCRVSGANEGLYTPTMDPRVKLLTIPIVSDMQVTQIFIPLRCKLLIISASNSVPTTRRAVCVALINMFARNAAVFQHRIVPGNHDVHLNDPEKVAPLVATFLTDLHSSL